MFDAAFDSIIKILIVFNPRAKATETIYIYVIAIIFFPLIH
jgi:hypothetical protein